MSPDNLQLWHSVSHTDPAHVKPITGKQYKGTSPKPHWLIFRATETFGPCGIGWGFTVDERIENGAMIGEGHFERLHIAKVKVWYKWKGERGEVEHIGGTPLSGKRSSGATYTDEDAPKKSVTDALVKALSMIGFAGDIFMGRYDDSKYVREVTREFAEADRESAPRKQDVPPEPDVSMLISAEKSLEAAARMGSESLRSAWGGLTKETRISLREGVLTRMKAMAAERDSAKADA